MLPRGKKSCEPHLTLKNQASSHPSERGRTGFRRCQERGDRKASPAPTARCPQFPAPGLLPLHNHPPHFSQPLIPLLPPCPAESPSHPSHKHPFVRFIFPSKTLGAPSQFSAALTLHYSLFTSQKKKKPKARSVQRDFQQWPNSSWHSWACIRFKATV